MGSKSDLPIAEKAVNVLKSFKIPYEVHVYSAHRTPEQAKEFAQKARENGFGVIIAAAGMAAILPVLLLQTLRSRLSVYPAVPRILAASTLFFQPYKCPRGFLSPQSL